MAETTQALRDQAGILRAEQRMIEADAAIARAANMAPDDGQTAFLLALSRYELGYPAAALFARAQQLWPDNPDVLRNQALAMASEGEADAAQVMLAQAVMARPDWLDGHRVLTAMRWTHGDHASFDASYAEATHVQPSNSALWLAWFAAAAQIRDWSRARMILQAAELALGRTRQLALAQAFFASESGDETLARGLFAELGNAGDPMIDLAHIRLHLRHGDPQAAEALALPMLNGPMSTQVWPYLSLIWRLLDDPRAVWLDGDPAYAGVFDVGLTAAELDALAELLRQLHTANRPYVEQSVRGGTQTDRSVLLRHEPILQRTRMALMETVHSFVAGLPAPDPRHPLLARPRDNLRISGSWSVRLEGEGYNVAHTHPMGWISSAFYVAVPDPDQLGVPPSGHLCLGVPPAELGLNLKPYREIAPAPGKLALFPSTMWHSTAPFPSGERLNIAFDVVPA